MREQLRLSEDICLRLSKAFGILELFFMNLQANYEFKKAKFETYNKLHDVQPILKAA